MRRSVILAALALAAMTPTVAAGAAQAAPKVDCVYSEHIVGQPNMHYICTTYYDDGTVEVFYAPGPAGER
ncbi:hypothetical protein [Nocardia arizonensis]|uniref:hypothetical protein n=1 Tax=Nocardia arizonensis TaxID=1141647 RepID=UPI0012E1988C|nr:hypothetical protein [Nocardia arizonensis]